MMKAVPAVILALSLAWPGSQAWADSILCRGGVASTGDHQTEILAKCGEPNYRSAFYSNDNPPTLQEQWGYFIDKKRVFIFENGFLRNIVY